MKIYKTCHIPLSVHHINMSSILLLGHREGAALGTSGEASQSRQQMCEYPRSAMAEGKAGCGEREKDTIETCGVIRSRTAFHNQESICVFTSKNSLFTACTSVHG